MGQCKDDAIFSRDRRYRYRLTRRVDLGERTVMFLMLNPSRADKFHNDNTITKCIGFARIWGYKCLSVVNLTPHVATYPTDLPADLPEPRYVQSRNLRIVRQTAAESDLVVVAYGNSVKNLERSGGARGRARLMTRSLADAGHELHCLGVTELGHPRHPVRLAYSTALEVYGVGSGAATY